MAAEIGRARIRMRLLALAVRAAAIIVLAGAVFVGSRLMEPVFAQLVERTPEFMGVPVPTMVLGIALPVVQILRPQHVTSRFEL